MKYFTADLHIGHAKILEISDRGKQFSNIEHMNEYILFKINEKVTRKDELFILGDLGFNIKKWRNKIKCKHIKIVVGNHDRPQQLKDVFGPNNVRDVWKTKIIDIPAFLSHYCHWTWPKSHYGSIMLYGHSHAQAEDTLDKLSPNRRSMDVGVDNYYRLFKDYSPFSEQEVYNIMKERGGHHVKDNYNVT